MNILFIVEPLIEKYEPYWKGAWSNYCCVNLANTLGINGDYKYKIVINEPLSEKFSHDGIEKIVLNQSELLKPFPGGYLEATIKWYRRTWSCHELDYYIQLYKNKLNEFEPDLIITFSPVPYLKKAFPNALILHHEYSIFSRLPYPPSWFLDPAGMSEYSFPNEFRTALFDDKMSISSRLLIKELKSACAKIITAACPFTDLIETWRSRYRSLWLLPLQDSGYYSFDGIVSFKSQFDYLVSVLETMPSDIGLIVTMHPEYHVLSYGALTYLQNKYNNMLYSSKFDDYYGVSQYIIPFIDVVVTVSSSVGIQTLLFEKCLITYGNCFSYLPCKDIKSSCALTEVDIDLQEQILYWFITRYVMRKEQLYNKSWLENFIQKSIEKHKSNGLMHNFYDVIGDPGMIIRSIIDDILNNSSQIPQKVGLVDRIKDPLIAQRFNEVQSELIEAQKLLQKVHSELVEAKKNELTGGLVDCIVKLWKKKLTN